MRSAEGEAERIVEGFVVSPNPNPGLEAEEGKWTLYAAMPPQHTSTRIFSWTYDILKSNSTCMRSRVDRNDGGGARGVAKTRAEMWRRQRKKQMTPAEQGEDDKGKDDVHHVYIFSRSVVDYRSHHISSCRLFLVLLSC